jgi:hypothetical protein
METNTNTYDYVVRDNPRNKFLKLFTAEKANYEYCSHQQTAELSGYNYSPLQYISSA